MPFLLLDDATDEATRRLQEHGQSLLQPLHQQNITQRLQDFGDQQLQSLQQLNQPPLPGAPPPVPGVSLPQPPQQLQQLNQPLSQQLQQIQPEGLTDLTQRLQSHGQQVLDQAVQGAQQLNQLTPLAPLQPPTQPTQVQQLQGPEVQRGGDLQAYARQAAQRAGIDPDIFVRQIQQESGFNPNAKSPAGALGVAQFMPQTAAGMNLDPSDPYASLDAAARMDAQNLGKYGGDCAKMLAAYNAGPGNVDKYGGVPPFQETQNYVQSILGGAKQAVQGAVQGAVQAAQQGL